MNRAQLEGNLGADPDFKTISGNTSVCVLSVATSRRYQDKQGEWKDTPTQWHRVVLFEKVAEWAQRQLKKGARVHLEGEILYRTWDKPEGGKGYATEIRAKYVHEIVKPEKTAGSGSRALDDEARKPPADRRRWRRYAAPVLAGGNARGGLCAPRGVAQNRGRGATRPRSGPGLCRPRRAHLACVRALPAAALPVDVALGLRALHSQAGALRPSQGLAGGHGRIERARPVVDGLGKLGACRSRHCTVRSGGPGNRLAPGPDGRAGGPARSRRRYAGREPVDGQRSRGAAPALPRQFAPKRRADERRRRCRSSSRTARPTAPALPATSSAAAAR